jgi:hypothetical protein
MDEQNTASVDDLVWAREMLRSFSRMEKALRKELGSFGIEKIILKSPLFILLITLSIVITLVGVILWVTEKDVLYLSALLVPTFTIFYVMRTIKSEKQKNIFRFIGKSTAIPIPLLESLLNIIEQAIFLERERFETIIAWRVNLNSSENPRKFSYMLNKKTWENLETAQAQFLVLAILMVGLQRFLHNNRDIYNEHVKKIPLMNAGYNYKPTKEKKILSADDIQTFGFTE